VKDRNVRVWRQWVVSDGNARVLPLMRVHGLFWRPRGTSTGVQRAAGASSPAAPTSFGSWICRASGPRPTAGA